MKKTVVGILAHVDAGKTTLSESLLFESKVIKRLGRVDSRDAYLDNDEQERKRGITIYSKCARIPLSNERELVLLDTPGHVDFSTETQRALCVLDAAILLISAPEGIQSHTKTLWNLLKEYNIPSIIFVNKTDMPGFDKNSTLSLLTSALSSNYVDFSGEDADMFYENMATCSEELLDMYMGEGIISEEAQKQAFLNRQLFPVFFGSALKCEGVSEFITYLEKLLPFGGISKEFGAICYKNFRDKDRNVVSMLKIQSGTLKVKDFLNGEKVNEIRLYNGEKYVTVSEASTGDICAIPSLNNVKVLQTFGNVTKTVRPILEPVMKYSVIYPDTTDSHTMMSILCELEEQDPSLHVEKTKDGHINIMLMGKVEQQVLSERLLSEYGIEVSFGEGSVNYKETIEGTVEAVGHYEPLRHYAEVHLKLEPGERGSGIEITSQADTDKLAVNYQKAVLNVLRAKTLASVLTNSPLTDVKITLIGGKAHIKHTEGGDFMQAALRAVRQGLMMLKKDGKVRLLEPFYEFSMLLPTSLVGRAMTDIISMNGECVVSESDNENEFSVLTGKAPAIKLNLYAQSLAEYSGGEGKISLSFGEYEIAAEEEKLISKIAYDPDSDTDNPSYSVFCSHGAGTAVPWYEVYSYMHVPFLLNEYGSLNGDGSLNADGSLNGDGSLNADGSLNEYGSLFEGENVDLQAVIESARRKNQRCESFLPVDEIDDILKKSVSANRGKVRGAHKGISASMQKKRYSDKPAYKAAKEVEYHGTPQKEKYLLVDGYNVIHAWHELDDISAVNIDGAAGRLNDILANYAAISGYNIIVVYDAYRVAGHRAESFKMNDLTIVYTAQAQTADCYIERFTHENARKCDITVATSDGLEQIIVAGAGCPIISSRELIGNIEASAREFNEKYDITEN